MYAIKRYNDLLIEIDLCRLRIKSLKTQVENIDKLMITPPFPIKGMSYDGMPKGSTNHTSLDRYVVMRNRHITLLEFEVKLLEDLEHLKTISYNKIKDLKGIEYKIAYFRIVKGMSYKSIAEKLGKNEQYIRNLYSKAVNGG